MLLSSAQAFRFFKMTRYLLGTSVLQETIRKSLTSLVIPVYLLLFFVA